MFTSARLKLTAWYLLIIMFISLSFSLFIYRYLSLEIDRFARTQRIRIERRNFNYDLFRPPLIDIQLIEETKHRLFLSLLVINGAILGISGALGFFLAGQTLNPIQTMVEEQNRFISDSSHELRTPLTALKSSLEVNLRDKKLTLVQAKKLMSDNITEVNNLQLLSDGLLKLTQYQSSQKQLNFQSINIVDVVHNSIAKVQPLLSVKNIKLTNKVSSANIYGDLHSLTDLFVILLDNAIKYSPEKTKIIITSTLTHKTIKISVKDQGIGISQKDLPHIFDRFYRSDISRTRTEISGFGLGLSIAQKIVDQHHGKITVTSQPDHGTTFTVSLQV